MNHSHWIALTFDIESASTEIIYRLIFIDKKYHRVYTFEITPREEHEN